MRNSVFNYDSNNNNNQRFIIMYKLQEQPK